MANIALSLALGDYDHVRDLVSGRVRAESIDLAVSTLPVEELLYRFLRFREWDGAERGFGSYASLLSQDDRDMVGLPVFPSRMFRHSAFYVRSDAGIRTPGDLAGKRVGVPEWAMTAAIYARGLMTDRYRVDLASVRWIQAGLHEPGRTDKTRLNIPDGFDYRPVPDRSLAEMLLAGDLDAVISARRPDPVRRGDPRMKPLFEDLENEETAYWKDTGIFPIMHLVVLRRDVYEKNRWIAMNLFKAFEEAKSRSLARVHDIAASYFPIPLLAHHVGRARAMLGEDFWPYGVEPNRKTLETFLRYCFEQGVCHRSLAVEELFAPEVQAVSRT